MAKRTGRVWLDVWNNFVKSLQPRQIRGNPMGADHLGNKYFEIPADPSRGKRKPSRWFEPPNGEDGFDCEKPSEWESWLRFRRNEPPSQEEVLKNLSIIHLKQKNAALLDEKYGKRDSKLPTDIKGMDSFPKYDEYHYGLNPPKK